MTSQTSGAVPGSSPAWTLHAGAAAADHSCATRLSLVRGASGAAPCKAPVGGGVGGPRVVRGLCAPPAGVVAPRPVVPGPMAPRDFSCPPLLAWLPELHTTYLRPAPGAPAGAGRGVPAHATQITPSAGEAGDKEENHL
jgi:hypothetical protein